jgi:hypothetical protein
MRNLVRHAVSAAAAMLVATSGAFAADEYQDIDCKDSKVFVGAGMKCRTKRKDDKFERTRAEDYQTFGADGDASFAVSMRYAGWGSHMLPPGESDLQWRFRSVAGGPTRATEWTPLATVSGSLVARFKRDGKFPCFAFYTTGPRSPGYKEGYRYLASGYVCRRAGSSFASDADVAAALKRITYRD